MNTMICRLEYIKSDLYLYWFITGLKFEPSDLWLDALIGMKLLDNAYKPSIIIAPSKTGSSTYYITAHCKNLLLIPFQASAVHCLALPDRHTLSNPKELLKVVIKELFEIIPILYQFRTSAEPSIPDEIQKHVEVRAIPIREFSFEAFSV